MTTSFDRTARLGAALGTALVATALLAPTAHADGQWVSVSSQDPKAGCSYTLVAVNVVGYSSGYAGAPVTFYDNGEVIDTVTVPAFGETKTSWRPSAAGSHEVTAKVDGYGRIWWITPATVTVAPNTGTGSAACGFPSFSG
ncbi:hypothetical protein [Nocardia sp. NPDC059195]|uniref:hypothetical protein n=1 Tax=Nocardia sp. NPDC059195 TaxID=3346765 RepID=UPI0036B6BB95